MGKPFYYYALDEDITADEGMYALVRNFINYTDPIILEARAVGVSANRPKELEQYLDLYYAYTRCGTSEAHKEIAENYLSQICLCVMVRVLDIAARIEERREDAESRIA